MFLGCVNALLSKAISCWLFTISHCISVDWALEKMYWHKYKQNSAELLATYKSFQLQCFPSLYFPSRSKITLSFWDDYLIWQEFSYPDWILSALGSRECQSIWVQFSGLNTQRTTDEDWLKNSTADSGLLSVSVWSSYNLMWVSSSVFSCDYFSLGDLRTTLFLPCFGKT